MAFKKGNKYRFRKGQTHYLNGKRMGLKNGHIPWNKGLTKETDSRLNYERPTKFKGIKGKLSPNWKDGRTPINQSIRTSKKYKDWRESVFALDDYTCLLCDKQGGHLHAHHIKQFAKYPKERFNIANGITMCRKCHGDLHGKVWK